jgi:hypothetical protein
VVDAVSPLTVHPGDGLGSKHVPEPVAPVSFIAQVVPAGFDGGVQVRTALVWVLETSESVGALSDPALASAYVPNPVAER